MLRRAKSPPSKLAKLKAAIKAVVPGGLPKPVERFYAKADGRKITVGDEQVAIAGLAEMFGGLTQGAFAKHVVLKSKADAAALDEDGAWLDLPFYEQFFDEHDDDRGKKALERLNLRMRLKLLVNVPGESTHLAIDFDGKQPTLYYVDRGSAAYALNGLTFDELVDWTTKFGARRWYFAFLDKKAEADLNIDLRAELERSLAEFPAEEWAALLARMPRKKEPRAARVASVSTGEAGADAGAYPALGATAAVLVDVSPRAAAFSADGRSLVLWDGNYDLHVYDVGSRKRRWKQKNAASMDVAPDDDVVVVLEHAKVFEPADRLVVRSLATGKALHAKPWKLDGATFVRVACLGGGRVAVADARGALHVVDIAAQRLVKTIAGIENVRTLARAGVHVLVQQQAYDAGRAMVKGASKVACVDLEAGKIVKQWKGAAAVAASPDASHLALRYIGKPSTVKLVEFDSDRVLHEIPCAAAIPDQDPHYGYHVRISRDGTLLAIADRDEDPKSRRETSTVSIYETGSGKRVHHVDVGRDPEDDRRAIHADGLALSGDGLVCVAADRFGARLWSLQSE